MTFLSSSLDHEAGQHHCIKSPLDANSIVAFYACNRRIVFVFAAYDATENVAKVCGAAPPTDGYRQPSLVRCSLDPW